MSETVPPLPYKAKVLTDEGFLAEPWSKWFRQMYERIGGRVALSNVELEDLPNADLAAVEADITLLQTQFLTFSEAPDQLNQGPVL